MPASFAAWQVSSLDKSSKEAGTVTVYCRFSLSKELSLLFCFKTVSKDFVRCFKSAVAHDCGDFLNLSESGLCHGSMFSVRLIVL